MASATTGDAAVRAALGDLVTGRSLDRTSMAAAMRAVMSGAATPAQIGALLTALRIKGETVDELTGAASVMRELSTRVDVPVEGLVDTCGTGGTGKKLFNVSTASAFVAAAGGARVAKHGNRGATSKSGSADVLEAAGARLDLTPEDVARCIGELGVGFLFAVQHHGAMRHAIGPRRELGFRTLFNYLGPMTNPAGVRRQVLGVALPDVQHKIAEALRALGSEHVLVVHADDGLDEFSTACATRVVELRNGTIEEYAVTPEDLGVPVTPLESLAAGDPQESLALVRQALTDEDSAPARIVALNAGAALFVAGVCADHARGVRMAHDLIASGQARERFDEFMRFTALLAQMREEAADQGGSDWAGRP